VEDDGKVYITSPDKGSLEAAKKEVDLLTAEVEVGKNIQRQGGAHYAPAGRFLWRFSPGQDGLVHISAVDVSTSNGWKMPSGWVMKSK